MSAAALLLCLSRQAPAPGSLLVLGWEGQGWSVASLPRGGQDGRWCCGECSPCALWHGGIAPLGDLSPPRPRVGAGPAPLLLLPFPPFGNLCLNLLGVLTIKPLPHQLLGLSSPEFILARAPRAAALPVSEGKALALTQPPAC